MWSGRSLETDADDEEASVACEERVEARERESESSRGQSTGRPSRADVFCVGEPFIVASRAWRTGRATAGRAYKA